MLPLSEARRVILDTVPSLDPESILVADASGRILRETITAAYDLPPFDTSAVDGYAVRVADVATASQEHPVTLKVSSVVAAGHAPETSVEAGTCHRIFTGAMIPSGADAIVMQEDTTPGENSNVQILDTVKPWESIRFHGEDIRRGAVAIEAGARIKFSHVALLHALGTAEIRVSRQPRVAIVSTGSELCSAGETLTPGRIFESNRAPIAAMIKSSGGIPTALPIARDDRAAIKEALRNAFAESDVVVTIGGVSVGDLDLVRPVFAELGGEIHFWKIAVRPGKPFVYGTWQNKVLFGLPGNPVSAAVCFWLLVHPALLKMQGASVVAPPEIPAILGEAMRNKGDRPHFARVQLKADGKVYLAGTQASHLLKSMSESDGLVEVPADSTLLEGSQIRMILWN